MADSQNKEDMGGITLTVKDIEIGVSGAGKVGTGTALSSTELGTLDGVTAGTVTASKAVVVDASKNASAFAAVGVVDLDAGSSGVAGTVDVFPTTASKGKIQIAAADSAGDTTTTITNASQAAARTYTIPDAGAAASFVMTAGAQTVGGVKTFSSNPTFSTGKTLDLASTTATLSSNAATITSMAAVITTESLSTAGGASQALTLTLTGLVAAGDLAMVQYAGGTNTTRAITLSAVTSTDTVTVTVYNNTAATQLNGTIIFNLVVWKA